MQTLEKTHRLHILVLGNWNWKHHGRKLLIREIQLLESELTIKFMAAFHNLKRQIISQGSAGTDCQEDILCDFRIKENKAVF